MIVSTADTIPGNKIVKTLGLVTAKSGWIFSNREEDARNNLEKKAEQLGANAIIGYRSESVRSSFTPDYVRAYGTAVIVE